MHEKNTSQPSSETPDDAPDTPGGGEAARRWLPAVPTPATQPPAVDAAVWPDDVGRAARAVQLYLARLAPSGRRVQHAALERIAGLVSAGALDAAGLPWHRLGYEHTHAARAWLAQRYAPSTANRHLAALRGVLTEARRLGLMTPQAATAAGDLPAVRGRTPPAGRALSYGELAAVFATCASRCPHDLRDAALLAVLYQGGLRRSEAVALDVTDHDPGDGLLQVRHGKGRKPRRVWLSGGANTAVATWHRHRHTTTDGDADDAADAAAADGRGDTADVAAGGSGGVALFVALTKSGAPTPRRLSAHAVAQVLARRAAAAGVAAFTAHDLRRTMISQLLDAGADLATVAGLAGHTSVATTAGYDRRDDHARRAAAALLHVPYTPPAS